MAYVHDIFFRRAETPNGYANPLGVLGRFIPGLLLMLAGLIVQAFSFILLYPGYPSSLDFVVRCLIMLIGLAWMFMVAFDG